MSSLRKIEANRRNAQKSTGPTSVTGKAISSLNAIKTGIHGKSRVLPSEKLDDLRQLTASYYRLYQPTSPEARLFVNQLIHCDWVLRRYFTEETQLQRHADATLDAYCRALEALNQLQAPAPPALTC